ncbi:MAG: hypothetical protein LBB94_04480 [Clostridiales bacterium]|jgi:hypothetical protein|nr:hypothetical protein [Clostridiales bacterium]
MKTRGFLILLLAVFLGVYAEANAGAVNNIARVIAAEAAEQHAEGSFFVSALVSYHRIPGWITTAAAILFRLAVCLLALRLKPGIIKQGGGFVLYKPLELIGNGLLGYCAFMSLILAFIVSIFGIPLAFALLAIVWFMTLLGETALALAAGYLLVDSAGQKSNTFTYMSAGALLIELLRCLPVLGYAVGMFLMPVICIGVVITLVYEGYLKKNYWELPFWTDNFAQKRANAREIILKDIDH